MKGDIGKNVQICGSENLVLFLSCIKSTTFFRGIFGGEGVFIGIWHLVCGCRHHSTKPTQIFRPIGGF